MGSVLGAVLCVVVEYVIEIDAEFGFFDKIHSHVQLQKQRHKPAPDPNSPSPNSVTSTKVSHINDIRLTFAYRTSM